MQNWSAGMRIFVCIGHDSDANVTEKIQIENLAMDHDTFLYYRMLNIIQMYTQQYCNIFMGIALLQSVALLVLVIQFTYMQAYLCRDLDP